MANYIFENLTQAQAAGFTSADYLIFSSSSTSARSITVTPAAAPSGSTAPSGTDYGVTLSDGTHTLTFPSAAIAGASQASGGGHLVFNDSSTLLIGSNSNTSTETLTSTSTASTTGTGTVVYGLGGSDSIVGGNGNDYLYGGVDSTTSTTTTVGTGGDTIVGGNGNNHIYGNALGTTQGAVDGNDSITAGTGSNYINGNAGNDSITVGTNAAASVGFNRVFGGAGNDTITIQGAAGSHAAVNGNTGNDTINDSSAGTNTLRGGQGNDTITQSGASHDVIMGDAGTDTLVVSGTAGHVAVLTGGADADTFDFSTSGAGAVAHLSSTDGSSVTSGATGSLTFYQEITDFTQGTDHIHLSTTPTTVATSGTTFNSVSDAQAYAQTLIGTSTTTVASLSVGTSSSSDTYLFYHLGSSSTTADGVIHLDGVAASTITASTTAASSTFA